MARNTYVTELQGLLNQNDLMIAINWLILELPNYSGMITVGQSF